MAGGRVRRGSQRLSLVALALASMLLTLLVFELGLRLASGRPFATNHLVREMRQNWRNNWIVQHDPELGWIPRPGTSDSSNEWRVTITIGDDGIRKNGAAPPGERPCILAVGDSFTFGDKVGDEQTWPALLERQGSGQVLNAGVSAYGLDQTVLRAEQLARKYHPDLLIVSFIGDDVTRIRFAQRGGAFKPYFEVEHGALVLRNVPVPAPVDSIDLFRRTFGYSHFVDWVMRRVAPMYWLAGPSEELSQDDGLRVACLLMGRLEALSRDVPTRVLVVAQARYNDPDLPLTTSVLGCASANRLETLDLVSALQEEAARSRESYDSLWGGHMTPAGNRFIAERIHAAIRARQLVPG